MDNNRIKRLVGDDKLKQAIKELLLIAENYNSDIERKLILLHNRFDSNYKEYNSQMITREIYKTEIYRIGDEILRISDELDILKNAKNSPPKTEFQPRQYELSFDGCFSTFAILIVIIGVLYFLSFKTSINFPFKKRNELKYELKSQLSNEVLQLAEKFKGEKIITESYCNETSDSEFCPIKHYYVVNFIYNVMGDSAINIEGKGIHSTTNHQTEIGTAFSIFEDPEIYCWKSTISVANDSVVFTVSSKKESWTMSFYDWTNKDLIKGDFEIEGYNKSKLLLQSRKLELEVSSYMRKGDSIKGKFIGELDKGTLYELYGFGREETVNSKKGIWCFIKLKENTKPDRWIWKQNE